MAAAIVCAGMSWAQSVEAPPISDVLKDSRPDPHALDFLQLPISLERGTGVNLGPSEQVGVMPVYRAGGKVTPPHVIHAPDPKYSREALKKRIQGTVVLWAVVEPDGTASRIRVQKSLGYGLDEQAIVAVKKWRFEPSKKDGIPVAVQIDIEVNFRL
jgi:protein TonB